LKTNRRLEFVALKTFLEKFKKLKLIKLSKRMKKRKHRKLKPIADRSIFFL